MTAKHARHEMREDKNFEDADTSEITAHAVPILLYLPGSNPFLLQDD